MHKVCHLNRWESWFCSNFLHIGKRIHLFMKTSEMIKRVRAKMPPMAVQRTSAHFLSFSKWKADGTFDRKLIEVSKFLFKHFVDKVLL